MKRIATVGAKGPLFTWSPLHFVIFLGSSPSTPPPTFIRRQFSVVPPVVAVWLALFSVICPTVASFSDLNRNFFLATKKEQPVRFQGLSKVTNQILGNWKTTLATFFTHQPTGSIKYMYRLKSHVFERLNFFYFKVNVIKRQLNFVSPKFGLKSYLWFQIKFALRVRCILKTCVWFQTKLHYTQFNNNYERPWKAINNCRRQWKSQRMKAKHNMVSPWFVLNQVSNLKFEFLEKSSLKSI